MRSQRGADPCAHPRQPSSGAWIRGKGRAQILGKGADEISEAQVEPRHFGNFSQALAQNGAAKPFEKTWEYEIGTYIEGGRFPNVYADISYFWWVLDGSADKDEVAAVKKFFAKYFEADPLCERLMFGTDWNMAGRAQGAAQYVDNVEAFFRDMGLNEQQLDNLSTRTHCAFWGWASRAKR